MFDELSARHYFIRAAYHWCVDFKHTPFILVRCADKKLPVPSYLIDNGKIVFNISPVAVRELVIESSGVYFTARFGGVTREIKVDLEDILAVYAQEAGKGISFPPAVSATAKGKAAAAKSLPAADSADSAKPTESAGQAEKPKKPRPSAAARQSAESAESAESPAAKGKGKRRTKVQII